MSLSYRQAVLDTNSKFLLYKAMDIGTPPPAHLRAASTEAAAPVPTQPIRSRVRAWFTDVIADEISEVLKKVNVPDDQIKSVTDKMCDIAARKMSYHAKAEDAAQLIREVIDIVVMYAATSSSSAAIYRVVQLIFRLFNFGGPAASLLSGLLIKGVSRYMEYRNTSYKVQAMDTTEVTEIAVSLWQTVCVIAGMKAKAPKGLVGKVTTLFDQINTNASKTRGLMNFFKGFLTLFQTLYRYIMDKCFGISHTASILERDPTVINRWIKEVHFLIDPANRENLFSSRNWRARLISAMMIGNLIQEDLLTSEKKVPMIHFHKMWERMQNLHEEIANRGDAYSIRREPVCVWFSGPEGIGKSHMSNDVMHAMMDKCDIPKTCNSIFTYTSGMKHWTGVDGAKIIEFDDLGVVDNEALAEDVSAMMQLISPAKFTPEQAAIPDKGKTVTPHFVHINSNESHPDYHCVRNKRSFYRRRHVLVDVRATKEFTDLFANIETKGALDWVKSQITEINRYPHLLFRFGDPMEPNEASQWESWITFEEKFMDIVYSKYQAKDVKYREALEKFIALEPQDLAQPFEDLLKDIGEKSATLGKLSAESCKEYFNTHIKKTYVITKALSEGAYAKVSELIKSAFGTTMTAQAPSVDESDISESSYLTVNGARHQEFGGCFCHPTDIKNVRSVGNELFKDGMPFEITLCNARCRWATDREMYTKAFKLFRHSKRAILMLTVVAEKFYPTLQFNIKWDSPTQTDPVVSEFEEWKKGVVDIEREKCVGYLKLLGLIGCVAAAFKIISKFYVPSVDNMKRAQPVKIELPSDNPSPIKTQVIKSKVTTQPEANDSLSVEFYSSGDTKNVAPRVAIRPKGVKAQYVAQAVNPLHGCFNRNMVTLVLSGTNSVTLEPLKPIPLRCLGVCGRWLVILRHYAYLIDRTPDAKVEYVNAIDTVRVEIAWRDCKRIQVENSEVVFIELPYKLNCFRDIRKWFMTEDEASHVTSKAWAYEYALGSLPQIYELKTNIVQDITYDAEGVSFTLPCALQYNWESPGRCCTPIYAKLNEWRIIGIHIAGGPAGGIAEPIIRETLGCLGGYSAEEPNPQIVSDEAQPAVTLEGDLELEGITIPKFSAQAAVKTQITPSVIHGYTDVTTQPAPLHPRHVHYEFSPLVEGCNIHGRPPKDFSVELLDRAQGFLKEEYLQKCLPVRSQVGVLSVQDAVMGYPGLDGYGSMEMNTSEGFPYTATRPKGAKDKRYLFNIREENGVRTLDSWDELLNSIMTSKDQLREQGIIPFTVFTDCLKDARIKTEKYMVPGKTRVFSISPADYTVQFRQYFLDIIAAQKVNRFDLQHAVGINPLSLEWSKLGRMIQSKGKKVICGDYSNFGPRLNSEVVRRVGQVWCDWYEHHEGVNPINRRKREIMFEELRHAVHQCGNILYRVLCGAPSGAPPTVNVNNDVNKLYIYMAWLACWNDSPMMCTYVAFKKHCVLMVYGDDLLINVTNEAIKRFNNEYLQSFFAAHDIRYTDERKGDSIRKWGTFQEATFLKGRWVYNPERPTVMNYGLDEQVVRETANWINQAPNLVDASRQTTCDSLMLAYGHGREFFDAHRTTLLAAWAKRQPGEHLTLYTYDEMDQMRFGYPQTSLDLDQLIEAECAWRARQRQLMQLTSDLDDIMGE